MWHESESISVEITAMSDENWLRQAPPAAARTQRPSATKPPPPAVNAINDSPRPSKPLPIGEDGQKRPSLTFSNDNHRLSQEDYHRAAPPIKGPPADNLEVYEHPSQILNPYHPNEPRPPAQVDEDEEFTKMKGLICVALICCCLFFIVAGVALLWLNNQSSVTEKKQPQQATKPKPKAKEESSSESEDRPKRM